MNTITPLPIPYRPLTIEVNDPTLAAQLDGQTYEEQCETAEDMAELGARVIKHSRPVEAAEQVLTEFSRYQKFTEQQSDRILADRARELTRMREQQLELEERINRRFEVMVGALEAATQATIRAFELYRQQQEQQITGVISELHHQSELIGANAAQLVQQNQHLKELAAEQETNPDKGVKFEGRVVRRLRRFAEGRGDTVEAVGAQPGEGGSGKKGDVLYSMRLGHRQVNIIIECKDRRLSQDSSNPYFTGDLAQAMTDRACDYGIVVATLQENQDENGPRIPMLLSRNKTQLVVLVDKEAPQYVGLEAALWIIAARASRPGAQAELDLDAIRASIQRLTDKTQRLTQMKQLCTRAASGVLKLREELDELDSAFEEEISQLEAAIKAAGPPFYLV
ncbi:MAG: hypothetical protein AB7S38_40125 [Vulcanimicrobiota bacterium]